MIAIAALVVALAASGAAAADCRAAADAALAMPAARAARAQSYLDLGLCEARARHGVAAEAAFSRARTIDATLTLPADADVNARGAWDKSSTAALAVVVDESKVEGNVRRVRITVQDPLALLARVQWRASGGTVSPPVRIAEKMELEVPAFSGVRIEALDAGGAVLVDVDAELTPVVSGTAAPVVAQPAEEPFPWLLVGGITAGVVVVAAAAAIITVVALQPPTTVTAHTDITY